MALSPHPLLEPAVRAAVQRAAEAHRGAWTSTGFTDLSEAAAHPCGIFQGRPFSVFAKLSTAADGAAQFTAELAGLRLLHDQAGVTVPVPVADGVPGAPRAVGLFAYLAVVSVADHTPFGRQFLARLDQAVTRYR